MSTSPLLPPVLETGAPEKLVTQRDLPADACCRGGKIGYTCNRCENRPQPDGSRIPQESAEG